MVVKNEQTKNIVFGKNLLFSFFLHFLHFPKHVRSNNGEIMLNFQMEILVDFVLMVTRFEVPEIQKSHF